ncbi:MAG: hypothetical protein JEY79_16895 [Pseudodesulfovibrio sp.]|nr:hypothetical protein [Pseudodesulfovibrio sp.]
MIETVKMIRLEKGVDGTFGVLRLDGGVFCVTLEPPDRNNEANISCIPAGTYICRRVESPGFGSTFEIRDVPGRSHILFHKGNVSADTKGCVLLGRYFGFSGDGRGVMQSGSAFREFLERCSGVGSFKFSIEENCEEGLCTASA